MSSKSEALNESMSRLVVLIRSESDFAVTLKKFPYKVEALFAFGKIYTGRQLWLKASEYHGLVLQKVRFLEFPCYKF
jgi:hypothetical protein